MKKKIVALVASLALVASVGAGATLAYLTSSTQTVTNTFTLGKVAIALDEADILVENGRTKVGNEYKAILPGATLAKDPTVYVEEGSVESYVFVKVTNASETLDNDGNKALAFTVNEQVWTQLKDANGNAVEGVYYLVAPAVAEDDDDNTTASDAYVVFNGVSVAGAVTEQSQLGDITIVAAATQKDYLTVAEAYALIADKLN